MGKNICLIYDFSFAKYGLGLGVNLDFLMDKRITLLTTRLKKFKEFPLLKF